MNDANRGLGRRLLDAFTRFAMRVAEMQVRILLVLFYYSLLAPFALLVRLTDPLAIRRRNSGWTAITREGDERTRASGQA